MVQTIYEKMQGVAGKLLTKFDQGGLYYIAMTPGAGPPDNPGPSVPTSHKLNAVARGVSFKYIDGSNVVATDQQVTLAVDVAFTPDITGFIEIDGVRAKIIQVIRKPAAGTPVAYTLIFRR